MPIKFKKAFVWLTITVFIIILIIGTSIIVVSQTSSGTADEVLYLYRSRIGLEQLNLAKKVINEVLSGLQIYFAKDDSDERSLLTPDGWQLKLKRYHAPQALTGYDETYVMWSKANGANTNYIRSLEASFRNNKTKGYIRADINNCFDHTPYYTKEGYGYLVITVEYDNVTVPYIKVYISHSTNYIFKHSLNQSTNYWAPYQALAATASATENNDVVVTYSQTSVWPATEDEVGYVDPGFAALWGSDAGVTGSLKGFCEKTVGKVNVTKQMTHLFGNIVSYTNDTSETISQDLQSCNGVTGTDCYLSNTWVSIDKNNNEPVYLNENTMQHTVKSAFKELINEYPELDYLGDIKTIPGSEVFNKCRSQSKYNYQVRQGNNKSYYYFNNVGGTYDDPAF